jgi:hypothetical protein
MKISARVACSPTEARRLLGRPDLLPLYEIAAETVERWIVRRIASVASGLPAPAADMADRAGSGRRRARAGGGSAGRPISRT